MKRIVLISALMAVTSCAMFQGKPIVSATPNDCSSLVPDSWKQGVPGVDLPGLDAAVGELWVAIDGQTGRLDQANGRTKDSIEIVERCEERDRKAVQKATQGFWSRIF
jgi:hypothetical protein